MGSETALRRLVAAVVLWVAAAAPVWPCPLPEQERLELRGQILAPDGQPLPMSRIASVSLFGATTPFAANVLAQGGRFRFRKLVPGSYVVAAFAPGLGEARQTVEVGKSLVDSHGRVELKIALQESSGRTGAGRAVSVRELAVPPAAWNEYERAQKKLGNREVEAAVEHLEKAIELAPHFVRALNHLGTICYHKREFSKAENYFRRALEQDGNAYEPLVNLGGTLLNLERYAEALQINRHATLARPDDALAHSQLGMNLFALGDFDRAITHLNRAKKLDPAHFSHPQLTLAEIYLRRGELEMASAEMEEFVRLHPDHPNAAKYREGIQRLRQK